MIKKLWHSIFKKRNPIKKNLLFLPEIGQIWYSDHRNYRNPFYIVGDLYKFKIMDIKKGSTGETYIQYSNIDMSDMSVYPSRFSMTLKDWLTYRKLDVDNIR